MNHTSMNATSMNQEYIDVLEEHLPYELDMLEEAFSRWASLSREADHFRRNSVIECFWVHARNIHEFFMKNQNRTASADHFTQQPEEYNFEELNNKIGKIHDQIVHLNYGRTRNKAEKLDFHFALRVKEAVDRAVGKFQNALSLEAKTYWKTRSPKKTEIPSVPPLASSSTTSFSKTIGFESR